MRIGPETPIPRHVGFTAKTITGTITSGHRQLDPVVGRDRRDLVLRGKYGVTRYVLTVDYMALNNGHPGVANAAATARSRIERR